MDEERDDVEPTLPWDRWSAEKPTSPVEPPAMGQPPVEPTEPVTAEEPSTFEQAAIAVPPTPASPGVTGWTWASSPPPPPPPPPPGSGGSTGPGWAWGSPSPAVSPGEEPATPPTANNPSWGWVPPPGSPGAPGGSGGGGQWPYTPGQYWAASPPPRGTSRGTAVILAVALLIVIAMGAGFGIGHLAWQTSPGGSTSGTTPPSSGSGNFPFGSGSFPFGSNSSGSNSSASGGPADASAIASGVDPSTVDVNTTLGYDAEEAAGTGIVLTSTGEVLTNNHVIDGATSISVTDVGNGRVYPATVVGYDRSSDVAVLQLQGASGLKVASLGNSATVRVGEAVVGIGNAGGVGGTPSVAGGSVTALNQSITATEQDGGNPENLTGLIEVNSDIQPGDSGGPLVNTAGKVLGMDTAASAGFSLQTSGTQGYAIPINTAISVAHRIESGQGSDSVHIGATGFLGIQVTPTDSGAAGAQVYEVEPGTPASLGGLTAGDVITTLNGEAVASPQSLTSLLQRYHPGDTVRIGWTDTSGVHHSTTLQLGTGPAA